MSSEGLGYVEGQCSQNALGTGAVGRDAQAALSILHPAQVGGSLG